MNLISRTGADRGISATILVVLLVALGSGATIRQQVSFRRQDLALTALDGSTRVELQGCDPTDEIGAPMLSQKSLFIPVPAHAVVTGVTVLSQHEQEIAGDFLVPIVQPQIITMPGVKPRTVEPNPAIAQSAEVYPREVVALQGQGRMRDENVVMVTVYPLRYSPLRHRLSLVTDLQFALEYRPGDGLAPSFPVPGAGFEYLIVTSSEMDSVFQRLAAWKTRKGIRAETRDIAWIEASYPGRDGAERLRNYLKACYPDSGLKWVLLGGDVGVMPVRYAFAMACSANIAPREDSLPCDLYFSDLNGDWDRNGNNLFGEVADSVDLLPDIYVGRAPVSNVAQAQVFVNKVLGYEQNPPPDYESSALFCGEVLWQNPYTDQGVAKNWIDDQYLPPGIAVAKLYQSQGTENLDTTIAELNLGRRFFNHDGHGWYDAMSVGGSPNYLRRENMDALTNGNRLGICYSIGCWTTAFDFDAVSEHFVLAPNGGGVAFIGNSSYGWGAPGNPRFGYSDRFDAEFYHQVFTQDIPEIGRALALDKLHFVPYSREANVYRWHQYQLNLLGDPEMPLWIKTPGRLDMTLPANVPAGLTRLRVTVQDTLGRPVANALVCALKGDETYATAGTDAAGQAWLSIAPSSGGNLTVTATAHNFRPSTAQVPVVNEAYVAPERIVLNDSLGNNDRVANPGEDIRYEVLFRNDGSQPASGLQARLHCTDSMLAISDSLAGLADLGPGDSAWARFAFSVSPVAQDRDLAYLSLSVIDGLGDSWTTQPAVIVGLPKLELKDYLFTDSAPGGNGNSVIEPGEEVRLRLRVRNLGFGFAHDTRAQVAALDSNLSVISDNTLFGTIAPESAGVSGVPVSILVKSSCPASYIARLQVIETSGGLSFPDTVLLVVGNQGLSEDFEGGAPGWTSGGTDNLWRLSLLRSSSPTHSFYCGSESDLRYQPNMDCWLLSPPFLAGPQSQLRFWHWFDVPIYGSDGLYVIIEHGASADTLDYIGTGGALGQGVDAIHSEWAQESYDLANYSAGETLRIRLRFKSDGDGAVGEGFYIDDVSVGSALAGTEDSLPAPLPDRLALLPNFPNPFQRMTTIAYQLPYPARVDLAVFDLCGRVVRKLDKGLLPAGYHMMSWSGLDERGRLLPAGVYICRLSVERDGLSTRFQQHLVLTR